MCGIAGWAGQSAPAGWVDEMSACLAHRGPDDSGEQQWPDAGLAFRRLALVDLVGGAQPATDERGRYWSVFNGEIYNHAELRAQLHALGHRLQGAGDADLVPHLYEQWGPQMLRRLRGMFAIAVLDRHTGELFLARDPFGIKPLYWTASAGRLAFASEVGALRSVGLVPDDPDPQAVSDYLAFGYVPQPRTMWAGVNMVPAGHSLSWRDGLARLDRWTQVEFEPDGRRGLDASSDELLAAVEDSVAVHLGADVPVGAYLSSGVDSSLLVALAARRQPVDTFSIGFEGSDGASSELVAARQLASQLGTRHHEQVVTAEEYWQALPQIVAAQEEPLADPSAPALWFLARSASQHVKAVLSGEGADELFGGYPIYREPGALRPVAGLPSAGRTALRHLSRWLPADRPGRGFLERATTPLERRFLGNAPVFDDDSVRGLLADPAPHGGRRTAADVVAPSYRGTEHLDDVARMQAVGCQTWLPSSILAKADKMSMAHSLEVRVPYLDREVLAVAQRLPVHLRVHGQRTKVALRAAAAQVLPAEVAARPKLGFPVPFRAWMNGPASGEVRELFAQGDDSVLDRGALMRLLDAPPSPARERRAWSVMTYLMWRQQATQRSAPHPHLSSL